MYAILVSIALGIYSLILVDFSLLFQEISVNSDMLTSVQALYSAEGAIESSFGIIGTSDKAMRNIHFKGEGSFEPNEDNESFLQYNEEIDSFYIKRQMSLNEQDLNAAKAFNPNNKVVKSDAYLADGQTLDQKAYYGLEPLKARGFVLRETSVENNFNEIAFEYNQGEESSGLVFEVFIFPKEGELVDFSSFQDLKTSSERPAGTTSVKRIVLNTKDASQSGESYETGGQPLVVRFDGNVTNYKNVVSIHGFQPLDNNYIIHFQTLDNKPTHFKLAAFYQNVAVMLPTMMQTIDVIGATPTGLYQRIKVQRQSEEGIMPGLNFVHFSDSSIHK